MSRYHEHGSSSLRSIGIALASLAALAVVGFFGLKAAGLLGGDTTEDYAGPGHGPEVLVQVLPNQTAQNISKTLKDHGVIASQTAFLDAAKANPASKGIQPCSYALKQEMKATEALAVLLDPANCKNGITIQEGWRVTQVIAEVTANSSLTKAALLKALKHPTALGLPAGAGDDVEGYLFPATYQVHPGETATELLKEMVTKAKAEFTAAGLETTTRPGGLTPRQILVMASIIQAEGNHDQAKISRVFYNRLADDMPLQSDATVAYANNTTGTVWTSNEQRNNGSLYNTYVHKGLPPGPINNPGVDAIHAALHPAKGPWLYFVPVNLKTGETVFSTTFAEHQANVAKLQAWCAQTHDPHCK